MINIDYEGVKFSSTLGSFQEDCNETCPNKDTCKTLSTEQEAVQYLQNAENRKRYFTNIIEKELSLLKEALKVDTSSIDYQFGEWVGASLNEKLERCTEKEEFGKATDSLYGTIDSLLAGDNFWGKTGVILLRVAEQIILNAKEHFDYIIALELLYFLKMNLSSPRIDALYEMMADVYSIQTVMQTDITPNITIEPVVWN